MLEDFLQSYTGVLVVVSHDRYFLDKVCDHHFVLDGDGSGEVLDWQGSFSEYLDYRRAKAVTDAAAMDSKSARRDVDETADVAESQTTESSEMAKPKLAEDKSAKPLSNFEKRELERLESEMGALTEERDRLQKRVGNFDNAKNGYEELASWTEEADRLSGKIDEMEEKWLALAERA